MRWGGSESHAFKLTSHQSLCFMSSSGATYLHYRARFNAIHLDRMI